MARIPFMEYSLDEVDFTINFIEQNIGAYDLPGLSNNFIPEIPSVQGVHPLSIETGDSDGEDFQSKFPAIGVELVDDKHSQIQTIGRRYNVIEITQAFLDARTAVNIKNRKLEGVFVSDDVLAQIQTELTAKDGADLKLYAERNMHFIEQTLNISVWSTDVTFTRIVYLTLKSLLQRLQRVFSEQGVKNLKIAGQTGLYNYDFNTTLFGGEFMLDFMQQQTDYVVDTDILEFKKIDTQVEGGQVIGELT